MATIGCHASHEQFPASELLRCVQAAEQAGFAAAMCSDHLTPWSERQGESGFAWSWLGAALQATSLPYGVVNAPGDRYRPAIIAQAAATLAEMLPGRFWVALGSSQAMHEHVTGNPWPPKAERNARLRECVEVIRALWAGETATHHGRVHVEEAKLWSLLAQPPAILGAALSEATAEFVGGWADGLITVNAPREHLEKTVAAFRRGGGNDKPLSLQIHLSYAAADDEARANSYDLWRTTILPAEAGEHLRTVEQFDVTARFVRPEDVDGPVRIASHPVRHLEWLHADLELGFSHLYLHNVGRNQQEFIAVFGERVLSGLG